MAFRLNAKTLFLTYPECTLTKDDLLKGLQEKITIEDYIIASERHSNGNPHLHAYIKLKSPIDTRNSRCLDVGGFHGNYQGCRSSKNVIKYCTKEDDYIASVDVEGILQAKVSKKALVSEKLRQGKDILEVIEEHPELMLDYKKVKENVKEYFRDVERKTKMLPVPTTLQNPWNKLLPVDVSKKKCHYWIYSKEPNRGKTTGFLDPLLKNPYASRFSFEETYHQVREETKIIGIDEYRGAKIEFLNRLCDGGFSFRQFMGGNFYTKEKCLIIICSNLSIKECYPNHFILVEARFNEVNVD